MRYKVERKIATEAADGVLFRLNVYSMERDMVYLPYPLEVSRETFNHFNIGDTFTLEFLKDGHHV